MATSKEGIDKSVNISKGIIFTFASVYLIVYGLGVTFFIEQYSLTNTIPVYINYIPLLLYIAAIFLILRLLIFIKTARAEKSMQKMSRKKSKTSVYKQALFLLIFIFTFVPLFAPMIDQGKNTDQHFSIYNETANGSSDFRAALITEGYQVGSIHSSLSATERITDKKVLLVLLGTNSFYNPIYEIPYFIDFFQGANSLMLCHDFGSTNELLWEIFFASQLTTMAEKIPISLFPDGILRDNESYHKRSDFPLIKTFNTSHAINAGINKVLLSQATSCFGPSLVPIIEALAGSNPILDALKWDILGYSSVYSFVDKNNDEMYSIDRDNISAGLLASFLGLPEELLTLPLGGYPQSVFLSKEIAIDATNTSRVFCSSDASFLSNGILQEAVTYGYDNLQFALNTINWLTYGDKANWIIVFDEAHIRPENMRDMSSPGIFGFIIQYIVNLSTNPITAWIYPLLAIYTLRKYIPKKDKGKEEKKKAKEEERMDDKARFRTSSFFAEKITWYREKHKYGKALILLYRRLERKLNANLGPGNISTSNVINWVNEKEGKINKAKQRRIERFMDKILEIKKGKSKVKRHEDFEKLFYEMSWISENL